MRIFRMFSFLAITLAMLLTVPAVGAEDVSCNCVLYVRSQTGLSGGPATAAGYTESVMNTKGYQRVVPQAGAILVWDAWQKGAYDAGHIAIIENARYDGPTKKWIIGVRHANWGGCGIRTTTFIWGDLYGVNAYVKSAAPPSIRLEVTAPLYLSSVNPSVGEQVKAEFWVRNSGAQAIVMEQVTAGSRRSSDWGGVITDWSSDFNIRLEPGQSYKFSRVKVFDTAGNYFAEPVVKIGGSWGGIEKANRVWFTVQPGGRLVVSAPIYLSSTSPRVGEWVKAEFWIMNTGSQTLTIEQLTAGARRGSDWGGAWADFPSDFNIVLAPGQSHFYTHWRTFDTAGSYFAEPVVKIGGNWGGIDQATRIWFTVR